MIRVTLLTVTLVLAVFFVVPAWSQGDSEGEGDTGTGTPVTPTVTDAAEPKTPPWFVKGRVQMDFSAGQHEDSTFFLKRGRIGVGYKLEHAKAWMQVHAAPSGVAFYDGYVQLIEPWSGEKMASVKVGQQDLPFGHDNPTGPYRYMIDRAPVTNYAFPGTRDLGMFGHAEWSLARLDVGIVNGQGPALLYGNADPTTFKNFLWRVGAEVDWMFTGVSGYHGNAKYPDPADPTADFTGDRNRLGLDFGVRANIIPNVGRSIVIFELIQGTNVDTRFRGGYFQAAQELMYGFTVALRYSIFDPDSSMDDDGTSQLDAAVIYSLNDHTQFRFQVILPSEQGADVENDSILAEVMLSF